MSKTAKKMKNTDDQQVKVAAPFNFHPASLSINAGDASDLGFSARASLHASLAPAAAAAIANTRTTNRVSEIASKNLSPETRPTDALICLSLPADSNARSVLCFVVDRAVCLSVRTVLL